MGKKGSTNVQPVDPWEAGRADATFNRIDTYTPFGSLTYSGPERNQANLQLNPYLADNENRRIFSDRMLLDSALSRQADMAQGGLPSLTTGINPGALQNFFGLPTDLQQGFDTQANPPQVPDAIGAATGPSQSGAKGGAQGVKPQQGVGDIGGAKGGTPQAMESQAMESQAPGQKGGGQNLLGGSIGAAIGNPLENVSGQRDVYNNTDFGQATAGGRSILDRIDPNTFGQIGSLDQLQDFDMDRNRVEQSFFDRSASLLNPQYDQAEQRMVSDLRARGIPRDSEAFEREMSNFRRDKGETYSRLADQAVLSGGGEQSRLFGISSALGDRPMNAAGQLFGMETGLGQLGLGAQGQQFGQAGQLGQAQGQAQQQLFGMADMLGQRDIQAQLQNANIGSMNRATQFNELASLLGLQQVASPGLNNFFAPGNVDMMGAYGMNQQGQMANARNAANQKGGMLGGLGQLGGAAIGAGGFGGLFNPFGGGGR